MNRTIGFRLLTLLVFFTWGCLTISSDNRTSETETKTIKSGAADVTIPFSNRSDLDQFSVSRDQNISFVNDPVSDQIVMKAGVPEGSHYGMELDYNFEGVEEVHMKWEQYIPPNWTTAKGTHMKFPGIGNRDRHGWGGRRTDGTGGWSVRTAVRDRSAKNDALSVEFYVYHMDMEDWGTVYKWKADENGAVIHRGEWTEIGTYVRVNTPGKSDGIIRGWVNGELAFEKEDLRFRAKGYDQYDVQEIMWHIYHGGSPGSPVDQHVYFRKLEIWFGESSNNKE